MEEPSPAGVAVLAFYYETQRNGLVTDMESQCKTHCLTPFREVWLTACRCVQRLAAEAAYLQYHISPIHASPAQRCRVYFYRPVWKGGKKGKENLLSLP